MKTVLVTGSDGFLGKNLISHLQLNEQLRILRYEIYNTEDELRTSLLQADFVYHLAGVNRPDNEEGYQIGNADLTLMLVEILKTKTTKTPILLSSSAQAILDNPYGRSKKTAEEVIAAYAEQTGVDAYIYRLPNLFGKWSRPNYNSVVSTFCHNISHDLPIEINNPDHLLTLAYIDDVVEQFISVMIEGEPYRDQEGFCINPRTFQIAVKDLADLIYSFRAIRKTSILPDLNNPLTKSLYATYLSFLEQDAFSYSVEMKSDDRGWLFEVIKSQHAGQIFVSQTKPGVTRGGHYHHTKVEKFVVVQGEALIRFRKIDADEILEYPVSGKLIEIVDIPPGYTHDVTNIGESDVITLFWASEIFDPGNPDTYFMKV